MRPDWLNLGSLTSFPEAQPVLRKSGERRFVCVRQGEQVHALDDRCPHQGYPLSQGCVNQGVLTCEWHNWKFELKSGDCLFGGEPVRRYQTHVLQGQVFLDPTVDREQELGRLRASLRAALVDDDAARALREALRLDAVAPRLGSPALGAGFALLARDGAERAEYGFDHGLALLTDACSWVERGWLDAAAAFAMAATAIAEPSRHLRPRATPQGEVLQLEDPRRVAEDLAAERRGDAEARVRHLCRARGSAATVREALLPVAARHLWDYGHGAIFLHKAGELAQRFPEAAEVLLAAVTVRLGWATAETALPPFTVTRQAVSQLQKECPTPRGSGFAREALEAAVLHGERTAVAATWDALLSGCDPIALLRVIGHAAAVRLSRFDRTWEDRLDAEVGVLDVSHASTFVEAAIRLASGSEPEQAAQFALIGAGFVGKLHRGDGSSRVSRPGASHPDLLAAARARDLDAALALADDLSASGRLSAYQKLAPFAALESAVRPIFYAHAVKTTEALYRLEAADPKPDAAYLRALLALIVPTWRERNFSRIATVARKFLADGRPPEGLY
jgi:nitrite reductase/ring-hydroxylating ferredoxin subunit